MSTTRTFLAELKRRNVYRAALAYAGVSFVVWQVAEIAFPRLGLPDLAVTLVLALTILGFPVVLVLAWAYELKPEVPAAGVAAAPGNDVGAASLTESESAAMPASIAVLPFENMSPEEGAEYFADGVSEELTHALGHLRGLRVAARTSAFSFKGSRIDVREIGRRLGVSWVVEGSVRRAGNRLRVTAQLIDAREGYHAWSDRFERELDDVFAIQDDVVAAVVKRLQERLGVNLLDPLQPAAAQPAASVDAYDLYLKGRHWRHFDDSSLDEAAGFLERAIELDPMFAAAFAMLAETLTMQALGFHHGGASQLLVRARAAADRAIELAPGLADARLARALTLLYQEWAFPEARAEMERALRLNPSLADAHRWMEFYWSYVEHDYEQALEALHRARALDPLDTRIPMREATVQYLFGHHAEAERILRRLAEEVGMSPVIALGLMDTLHRAGRHSEAADLARDVPVASVTPEAVLGVSAVALAGAGRSDEARARLEELLRRADSSPFWTGVMLAALGEIDSAFESMARALERRDGGMLFLSVVPDIKDFQSDRRYTDLLRRMGLGHLLAYGSDP